MEEEEDRNLLLAAAGQRGGEGKLMAAWVDKGEDEGWQAVPEVDRGKQEGRDERDEGERGDEDRSLNQSLFGFNNCLNAHLHQK